MHKAGGTGVKIGPAAPLPVFIRNNTFTDNYVTENIISRKKKT